MKFFGKYLLLALLLGAVTDDTGLLARTKEVASKDKKEENELLRNVTNAYDLQLNTVSNLQFYTTNYGIFSYDVARSRGGGFWPRGTENQYIFAGGVWFGAIKPNPNNPSEPRTYVSISYNPNNGRSWMVPGRIEDGTSIASDSITKYRTYFSTDFRPDGTPLDPKDGANWPIWDTDPNEALKANRYFGRYVNNTVDRKKTSYPKGPAFISQEDIFATYKDTDLSRYDDGASKSRNYGYPLRLQHEQMIYSWGFGDYRDFIFIKYDIINMSPDVLSECWMAPVMDVDIALRSNSQTGADNDRARFYNEDESLNLAFQWTEGGRGEAGRGFGYLGFDFLESPAVDAQGFIRKDKKFYTNEEQLGLRTFKNWSITEDFMTEAARYGAMAAGLKDGDNGAGDKRFMMATGPFSLRPGDTARVVVGIIMANAASGKDAIGSKDDVAQLVVRDKFAQTVYDNNFQAPKPPELSFFVGKENGEPELIKGWKGINNGVVITWDSTAEVSLDTLERGLDFLGYRLYRAQRTENQGLDTFDVDNRELQRRGPLGWKEIARWELPKPFMKSLIRPGTVSTDSMFTEMDSLIILRQIDTLRYKVARVGHGTQVVSYGYSANRREKTIDSIVFFSDFAAGAGAPWSQYYKEIAQTRGVRYLIDSIFSGEIILNPALVGRDTLTGAQSPFVNLELFDPAKMDSANQQFRLSQLTNYILKGKGTVRFRDLEQDSVVRYHVITRYMDSVTNHRTFVDIGDDDHDGVITVTDNLATTERLINNLDYYYMLRAYDEGDYRQPTPTKLNGKVLNVNQIRTNPLAAAVGRPGTIEIISVDSTRFGGLYNFRFDVRDEERLRQLFGGDTLEIEFQPNNGVFTLRTNVTPAPASAYRAYYGQQITVKNLSKNLVIGNYTSFFEPAQCSNTIASFFSESSALLDPEPNNWKDSSGFLGDKDTVFEVNRKGLFKTDVECNRGQRLILGVLGFAFDYTIQQQGGDYRVVSTVLRSGNPGEPANPVVGHIFKNNYTIQFEQGRPFRFLNNGPVRYEMTLKPGGVEPMTVTTGKGTFTFMVPYDMVEVRNTISYTRSTEEGSAVVNYPDMVPHQDINYPAENATDFEPAENVGVGFFNISAFGWVNPGTGNTAILRKDQATCNNQGCAIGQGRYYHTAVSTDGKDTLKFTHIVSGNGISFMVDYANKQGRRQTRIPLVVDGKTGTAATVYPAPVRDMAVGDTVILSTYGGALGLPLPGAKILARVTEMTPIDQVNQEMMDDIMVVPNPYYVSHVAQRSAYDAKIFFTRLPERCTISIYTLNGDLVRTIEHNENSERPDREGMDVWDLQSSNRQLASSQVLIAKIETPSGASTIKKFSIVTAGFRQVP